MSARLVNAIAGRKAAQQHVQRVLESDYPVGAAVTWERGGRRFSGRVDRLCFGERLHVVNDATGRVSTISASDILTS